MPGTATTEFWRDIRPIDRVFPPDALPEVHIRNAATGDERCHVPFTDTVSSRPLWISPGQNKRCDILMAKGAGLTNRHDHPRQVLACTISGKWGYPEHDWTATAGDFVYETPGEGHRLVACGSDAPLQVFFQVCGPLIRVDEKGAADGYFDVHHSIALCKAHYGKVGRGAPALVRNPPQGCSPGTSGRGRRPSEPQRPLPADGCRRGDAARHRRALHPRLSGADAAIEPRPAGRRVPGAVPRLILTERLGRARRALATGETGTPAQLAWRCGFAGPSQFSRAYRREFGHAPSAARGAPVSPAAG